MSHPPTHDDTFTEIAQLIATARQRAVQAVNTTLIELYWQVGATISRKIEAAEWGDGVVTQLADYLVKLLAIRLTRQKTPGKSLVMARTQPGLSGFTRRNLFRMRQFYEAYRGDEKVSAVLTQLPWTHNLIILSQSQRPEEREFYLRMAVQEKWSSRELERQFKTALFERVVLSPAKVSAVLRQIQPEALNVFKGSYLVEFLKLPTSQAARILFARCAGRGRAMSLHLTSSNCVTALEKVTV
jgi:predicted nuclease of restriction endonuclease-like (RecB) superfamily